MIRPATEADYDAVIALMNELGIDDPRPTRERWVAQGMPDTQVFERDRVVGYVSYVALREVGHVRQIAVAPEARRSGVGRALMSAAAEGLRTHGLADWQLNVKDNNAPAIALYERFGMRPMYRSHVMRIRWEDVERLDGEADIASRPIRPDEDVELEHLFGIVGGRIALVRARPGRVVLQIRDADRAVGVACFEPEHPGAFPFKVARPSLARNLFEAMRPHALPQFEHVGVVAENDDALAAALTAAGATTKFRIVTYRGAIPA